MILVTIDLLLDVLEAGIILFSHGFIKTVSRLLGITEFFYTFSNFFLDYSKNEERQKEINYCSISFEQKDSMNLMDLLIL